MNITRYTTIIKRYALKALNYIFHLPIKQAGRRLWVFLTKAYQYLWHKFKELYDNKKIILLFTKHENILWDKNQSSYIVKTNYHGETAVYFKQQPEILFLIKQSRQSIDNVKSIKKLHKKLIGCLVLLENNSVEVESFDLISDLPIVLVYLIKNDVDNHGHKAWGHGFFSIAHHNITPENLIEKWQKWYEIYLMRIMINITSISDKTLSMLEHMQSLVVSNLRHCQKNIRLTGVSMALDIHSCLESVSQHFQQGEFYQNKLIKSKKIVVLFLCGLLSLWVILDVKELVRNEHAILQLNHLLQHYNESNNRYGDKLISLSNLVRLSKQGISRPFLLQYLGFDVEERIKQALQPLLEKQLGFLFAAPVMQQLHDKLTKNISLSFKSHDRFKQSDELKIYLMLESYLVLYQPIEKKLPGTLAYLTHEYNDWLWHHQSHVVSNQYLDTRLLVSYYLNNHKLSNNKVVHLSLDVPLIKTIRDSLREASYAKLLYEQYKASVISLYEKKNLQTWLGYRNKNAIFKGEISNFYSYSSWQHHIKKQLSHLAASASESNWVINKPINQFDVPRLSNANTKDSRKNDQLTKKLKDLYFSDVIRHWTALIRTATLPKANTLSKQAKIIATEVSTHSLKKLLNLISRNTAYIADRSNDDLNRQNALELNRSGNSIAEKVLENYISSLKQLSAELEQLTLQPNNQPKEVSYARKILIGRGDETTLYRASVAKNLLLLNVDNKQIKHAYDHLLSEPIKNSWSLLITNATNTLRELWFDSVQSFYKKKIISGPSVAHLTQFMRPKTGVLWNYVDNQLVGFIIHHGQNWSVNQWLGIGLHLDKSKLDALCYLEALTDFMFHDEREINLSFAFMPIPSHSITMMSLKLGEQEEVYYNGPQRWKKMVWQPRQAQQAALSFIVNKPHHLSFDGPWALLDLLDKATISQKYGKKCILSWKIDGHYIHIVGDTSLCRLRLVRAKITKIFFDDIGLFNFSHLSKR